LSNNPRYLDLAGLDDTGKSKGLLPWRRVDVPGDRPRTGFGAGIVLDPSDNLYIIGGVDLASGERDELFLFQLRDPFFKHCSATGSALQAGVAGVNSIFYLQCMDSFMEPASGASFTVAIEGPVSIHPGIVGLGGGKYSCSFTPVKMGTYTLSISVGRGGAQYKDLITGIDSEPSNNILDGEFEPQCTYKDGKPECKPAQNPYTLKVLPGPLSPDLTEATGMFLTLSTAGIISNFMVTVKDAFANRRPGGDRVSVLMDLWTCDGISVDNTVGVRKCLQLGRRQVPGLTPETSTITDNSDGSYDTQYSVTRAGQYQLRIQLAGTTGANSPFILTVFTDIADKALTYAYGNLKGITAGATSTVFVQTRDKYGNAIRADTELYPPGEAKGGTEDIQFELCKSLGNQDSEPCGGGDQYLDVGITVTYAIGPGGKKSDPVTKEPYWGLYEVVFFPFDSVRVMLRVLHGNKVEEGATISDTTKVVQCYFDTTGIEAVRSLMDPGDVVANKCIQDVAVSEASSRRVGWRHAPPHPLFHISPRCPSSGNDHRNENVKSPMNEDGKMSRRVDSSDDVHILAASPLSPSSSLSSSSSSHSWRRTASVVKGKDMMVDIKTAYIPPDNTILEKWTFLAPLICAGIGAFLGCCQCAIETYDKRQKANLVQRVLNNAKESKLIIDVVTKLRSSSGARMQHSATPPSRTTADMCFVVHTEAGVQRNQIRSGDARRMVGSDGVVTGLNYSQSRVRHTQTQSLSFSLSVSYSLSLSLSLTHQGEMDLQGESVQEIISTEPRPARDGLESALTGWA
jgi:hypothetical protein